MAGVGTARPHYEANAEGIKARLERLLGREAAHAREGQGRACRRRSERSPWPSGRNRTMREATGIGRTSETESRTGTRTGDGRMSCMAAPRATVAEKAPSSTHRPQSTSYFLGTQLVPQI